MIGQVRCLVPNCKRYAGAECHGQCLVCWGTTKKLIAGKKTTMEELAATGLIHKIGGDSLIEQALAKARKEKEGG